MMISTLPAYKGSISNCFDQYMGQYVAKEDRDFREYLIANLQKDEVDNESDLKVLNSSLYMFNYIKSLNKRSSQYSKAETMFNIQKVHVSLVLLANLLSPGDQGPAQILRRGAREEHREGEAQPWDQPEGLLGRDLLHYQHGGVLSGHLPGPAGIHAVVLGQQPEV